MNITDTNKEYQMALESLKKVNDDLFYSELRDNLSLHQEEMKKQYQDVQTILEDSDKVIKKLPFDLHAKMEEMNQMILSSHEVNMGDMKNKVVDLFEAKGKELENVIQGFNEIQNILKEVDHTKDISIDFSKIEEMNEKLLISLQEETGDMRKKIGEFFEEKRDELDKVTRGFDDILLILKDSDRTIKKLPFDLQSKIEDMNKMLVFSIQEKMGDMRKIVLDLSEENKQQLEKMLEGFHEVQNHIQSLNKKNESIRELIRQNKDEQHKLMDKLSSFTENKIASFQENILTSVNAVAKEQTKKMNTINKVLIALGVGQIAILGSIWFEYLM